jgi:hypothetical protein
MVVLGGKKKSVCNEKKKLGNSKRVIKNMNTFAAKRSSV